MQELESLQRKIELLVKQHTALQAENTLLKQKVDNLQEEHAFKDQQLADMEAQIKTLSVAGAVAGQKVQLKKYLDEVITIIEQNIAALRS